MGCCSNTVEISSSKSSNADSVLDDFNGPLSKRSCRDIPCLIIFIIFLGGMIAIAGLAVMQGNPYRFIYGMDSWGNICNQKNIPIPEAKLSGKDLTGSSKKFYFNKNYFARNKTGGESTKSLASCVSACPSENILTATQYNAHRTRTGINFCKPGVENYVDNDSTCPTLPITRHINVLNRCIPKLLFDAANKTVSSMFTSVFNKVGIGYDAPQKIMSDIQNSYQELLILIAIGFAASLLMVIFLRCFAAVIIWLMVIIVAFLSLGATSYCWFEWYKLDAAYMKLSVEERTEEAKQKVDSLMTYAIISSVIAGMVLLVLLVLRKRIGLVVQLFREAGRAIRSAPLLLFMPILTLIILTLVVACLAIVSVYMETSGDPNVLSSGVVEFQFPDMWNYIRWYHIFGILWISAFILACQDIVIAGAIATWFFTRNKSEVNSPICKSIGRLIRYHLGSVAFGSFIIALVRLVRLFLGYIQAKLKGKTSQVVDILLKILQCCLWCFDRFLRYINRNAYIEISIYGYSFCSSAKKAFFLIVNNALRVAAINSVGSFVLFLGKLSIVAIMLVSGNELLKHRQDINFIWVPVSLGCVFGFAVANCFLLIYEIAIDTIFLCFCEDIERNDGVHRKYFMSKRLQTYLNDSERKEKDIAKS